MLVFIDMTYVMFKVLNFYHLGTPPRLSLQNWKRHRQKYIEQDENVILKKSYMKGRYNFANMPGVGTLCFLSTPSFLIQTITMP